MAKTRLEYEDRVHWEQAKRIALEAQLQAIPNTSMDSNPHSTPQGRGTQPNNQGSQSSCHSQRAPSNTVAGRLAKAAGAGSAAEGTVGPTSHRGHRDQRSQRKPESSRSQPRHPPQSAPPSDNTIHRITDAIHDHAPHGGYQHPEVPDAGNEYFGQPQGGSSADNMLRSTTNLGAVGNAPNVPPPPIQPRDQISGSQM